jgi:hypothetical protein
MRCKAMLIAASFVLSGLMLAAHAQDQHNPEPQSPAPGDHGMMGNGHMPMTDMMQQMSAMMENCNKMMESHMQQQQGQPDK